MNFVFMPIRQLRREASLAGALIAFVFLIASAPVATSQNNGANPAPAQPGQPAKKVVFPATIVVSCDLECIWLLDGKSKGGIDEGKTASAGVQLGDHLVVGETPDGDDQVQREVHITEKGQTVIHFELRSMRDNRVNLEQQANAARPAEEEYEEGQMMLAQQQFERARVLLDKACSQDKADACASLGYLYDSGKGIPQDYKKASVAYQKACDGGDSTSCTSLGIQYEYGHGVAQDYGKARALYQKGCDGGYASGCSYLGDLYRTGHGVPKDPNQGRQLLQKGCDMGDEWGCNELKPKP